jgi:hexulose-6-phosphate isomerase
MIKGISYWSMPDGLANTCPIDRALALAKEAGFDALELCIAPEGELTTGSSEADCRRIRERVDAAGLTVETLASGMSWGANPLSDDPDVRQRAFDQHAAALERAGWLGCDAYLFVPGVVKSPISPDLVRYDRALDRARDVVARLLDLADRAGVDLCVENVWNGLFYSPVELNDFIDRFDHPRLGVYFDVGNVLGYHQHPPHWIELLGERIRRVHIKDFKESVGTLEGFCDLLDGDVPWPDSMAALKAVGYDRTVIAEMLPHTEGLLERTSRAMDRILSPAG